MVAGLKRRGVLERAIEEAADRTVRAESSLMQQGVSCEAAQEMVRQEWAFLPAGEDQPEPPNGSPERWLHVTSADIFVDEPLEDVPKDSLPQRVRFDRSCPIGRARRAE